MADTEGGLHSVTDDEYFESLESCPPIFAADGSQVDIREGVIDARPAKAEVEAAGGTWRAEDFL